MSNPKEPRDISDYVTDILAAITDINDFVGSLNLLEFQEDKKTIYAVIRCLEIIGEAVKKIPDEIREQCIRTHKVSLVSGQVI